MPEVSFWKEIKYRLSNYREEPDDDWDRIAGALDQPQKDYSGLNRLSDLTALILLAFLIGLGVGRSDHMLTDTGGEIAKEQKVQADIVMGYKKVSDDTESDQNDETPINHEKTFSSSKAEPNATSQAAAKVFPNDEMKQKTQLPVVRTDLKFLTSSNMINKHTDSNTVQPEQSPSEESNANDVVAPDTLEKKDESVTAAFQPKKESKKKVRRFRPSVFASITPTLGFYKLVPSKDDQVEIFSIESSSILSGERLGLQLSAGFEQQLTPKLKAYAGLSFSRMRQVIHYTIGDANSVDVKSQSDGSYLVSPGELQQTYDYRIRGLGFNAGLLYTISQGFLQHKVGGGIQFHSGKAISNLEQGSRTSKYLSYQLLYRVEYPLRPNLGLFVQPSYTRSFNVKESVDGPFKVKPHYGGIGIGLIYHF